MKHERRRYYIDENIEVILEEANGDVYVHVGLNTVNKDIVRKVRELWAEIVMKVYVAGYDALYTYTKDKRVVDLIGGADHVGDAEGFGVYKWDLT